ncbi:MAG: YdeI/OmpD-associated family protein [Anaerolineales bacterium]
MKPRFFAKAAAFRIWLAANHDTADEILLLFHKKASGKASMAIGEAVEQALCYGWIDGKLKSTGADSFVLRFTPRRPGSIWSKVNVRRVKQLTKLGLMAPAGLAAFAKRDRKKIKLYSYENRSKGLSKDLESYFRKQKDAWAFFQAQPVGYQKTMTFWVMSAKQEATRVKRLDRIIEVSARGQRVDLLAPFGKGKDK